MKRSDDFNIRRKHLEKMTDEDLKKEFWKLSEMIVDPMIEMARTYTSPSIERSVLLRMGFSSLEAKTIVEHCIDRGLMGKGAGHAVYKLSLVMDCDVREAGLSLMEGKGWDLVEKSFEKGGAENGGN